MTGPLLSSEPLQRYRALGLAGDPVWRAAGQLRAAIAQRLSREHADLLAVPEVDPSGRRIDWYAPFDGTVQRLADLGGRERQALLDKVHRLHGDLERLAAGMEAPGRPGASTGAERNFAQLLRHALTAPGEETLYAVDGRPVMTFWGFATEAALPGAFLASPPRPPMPAAPPPVVPEAVMASAPAATMLAARPVRSTWWQWLLLAALLLLLLAGLAYMLRPYLPHIEAQLEAEARQRALLLAVRHPLELQEARMDTLRRDYESLQLQLADLTDQLSKKGGDCAAGIVIGGTVVAGTSDKAGVATDDKSGGPNVNMAEKSDDKSAAKADDKSADKGKGEKPLGDKAPGDKTNDKSDVKPSPNVPDPVKDQAKDPSKDKGGGPGEQNAEKDKKDIPNPMKVPPEARQKQDLAFMQGDWRSRTGLATANGERDIRPSYTLDDKGKGKVSFVQKDGSTCEAPAEARWDKDKLVIEEKTDPKCSDGKTYARNVVNCEVGKDGTAQCSGSQPGDKRTYDVQIGR
ncbi:MAG: hypothetical protein JOY81_09745 [Alphaproteobacteria bacterium]|nr:hypothetical protein [Alphaproteobacteria bacterium]